VDGTKKLDTTAPQHLEQFCNIRVRCSVVAGGVSESSSVTRGIATPPSCHTDIAWTELSWQQRPETSYGRDAAGANGDTHNQLWNQPINRALKPLQQCQARVKKSERPSWWWRGTREPQPNMAQPPVMHDEAILLQRKKCHGWRSKRRHTCLIKGKEINTLCSAESFSTTW